MKKGNKTVANYQSAGTSRSAVMEPKPTSSNKTKAVEKSKVMALTKTGKFELPALPYAVDALEPVIDKRTMEIHHDKHHGTYVSNLNKALEGTKDVPSSIEEILKKVSKYPMAVRNNAGGHYNHSMFWKLMNPKNAGQPTGKLADAIKTTYGSFENFKSTFNEAATKHFGSGWAWLVVKEGKLEIGTTPNQDNPLMDLSELKGTPVLCLDVWEHAYYLKYQNQRVDYINAWWNVVNWEEATNNFNKAK